MKGAYITMLTDSDLKHAIRLLRGSADVAGPRIAMQMQLELDYRRSTRRRDRQIRRKRREAAL